MTYPQEQNTRAARESCSCESEWALTGSNRRPPACRAGITAARPIRTSAIQCQRVRPLLGCRRWSGSTHAHSVNAHAHGDAAGTCPGRGVA